MVPILIKNKYLILVRFLVFKKMSCFGSVFGKKKSPVLIRFLVKNKYSGLVQFLVKKKKTVLFWFWCLVEKPILFIEKKNAYSSIRLFGSVWLGFFLYKWPGFGSVRFDFLGFFKINGLDSIWDRVFPLPNLGSVLVRF